MSLSARLSSLLQRDVTYSVMSQVFVSGFNFAVGIAAARLLGIADFGVFTLILMIAMVISVAQGHVLTMPMMTFAGSRPMRSKSYFATIWALGLVFSALGGAAMMLILLLIGALRGDSFSPDVLLASAAITFAQNQQIMLRRILFAQRRRLFAAGLDIVRLAVMAVAAAVIVFEAFSVDVATLLYLLAASALLATLPFSLGLMRGPYKKRLFTAVLARHWPMSRWMILMLLVSLGQEQAIWVIVGVELGDTAIGGLRAAQYMLGITHTITLAMENHIPRNAAEQLRLKGREGLRDYLLGQSAFLGGAVIALIVLVSVYSSEMLTAVFGPQYAEYAHLTHILGITYSLIVINSIWTHYLRAIEDTRSVFLSYTVSSAAAVILIYPLMRGFGLEGVAICLGIAHAVCVSLVLSVIIRDQRKAAAARRGTPANTAYPPISPHSDGALS
ncbi:O-antigen/teichoic acid export membrane protein [Rhodobium orientis]|uniref:lipopolysaccharide biosynthesis protein n=1 Tax=Rhodobium orientis TaxID=34017 RepID=UPI001475F286|nr:lipopolysaccharide biosynthesis protein [Rhodobium orientis]MBB4304787.1 O-antigen/teichoic acid export membrane protein [Rhodobium orientis]